MFLLISSAAVAGLSTACTGFSNAGLNLSVEMSTLVSSEPDMDGVAVQVLRRRRG